MCSFCRKFFELPFRYYLLSLLFLFNYYSSFSYSGSEAKTGLIKGKLLDEKSNEPVIGATIVLLDQNNSILKGTITDIKGDFALKNLETGKYPLQISYIGYKTKELSVEVKENKPIDLSINLTPSALDLSTVEILGTSSDAISKMTGTATKLDIKTIQAIQPLGTQEILQYVPGVYGFADDGMGNSRISIGIRGLYPRRSSRVLILEDGIPIQPAIYLYPNMYYNPPAERLDEIEVIKGSSAIKYGPQTMGGVINYITNKPRRNLGGTVQLIGGTHNYKSTFVSVGGWGSSTFHPEIQLLYKSGDGFRDNNQFEQYNTTFKLNILTSKSSNLYLKANMNYENSNATYTGLTEYSFAVNPKFNPKKDDNFNVFRLSLDLIYNKQYNQNLISTTKLYTNHFNRNWWRENDVFVEASTYSQESITPVAWYTAGDLIRTGNSRDSEGHLRKFFVFGAEHSYDYEHTLFSFNSNLEIGARLHFDRFIDDKKFGFSPDARNGKYFVIKGVDDEWDLYNNWYPSEKIDSITILGQSYHYETTAFSTYVLEKVNIGKRLSVVPGVRFESFEQEKIDRLKGSRYQDKTTVVFLPGIGINYEIKNYNLFSGIHRGFTPPSDGTLNVLNFGQNQKEGLELNAELSWNTEIGIRRNTKNIAFEIAAFNMDIKNIVAAGRATKFENLGKARISGMESSLSISISSLKKFLVWIPDFHVTYTYLHSAIIDGAISSALYDGNVDISGNRLPYAPEHTYILGISKDFKFGLSVRTDVQYIDWVYSDFENIKTIENRGDMGVIPKHRIYNASISYKINKNFKLSVAAKNLTNEVYIGSRLHSNPRQKDAATSSGIIPGAERQINLSIKFLF